MLYEYLIGRYDIGEPIFLSDVKIEGISEENLRYHFKKLVDNGIICRFDAGVYYFPKINMLGERSDISVDTVIRHKYINRKGSRVGFYSGYALANRMGLTTQVPFMEEITSNYAPAPVRELVIKNRRFIIRRPPVVINKENIFVLQMLECLKDIDRCAEEDKESCGRILSEYVKEHGITRDMIDKYIGSYPLKIYKALYETGGRYVSA